jgi:hypothetical protein
LQPGIKNALSRAASVFANAIFDALAVLLIDTRQPHPSRHGKYLMLEEALDMLNPGGLSVAGNRRLLLFAVVR